MRHICALLKTKLGFGSETLYKQPAENDVTVQDCVGTCTCNFHTMIQKDSHS